MENASKPVYGQNFMREGAPAEFLPEKSMPSKVAYQMIMDQLLLDGNPNMNLASFVTTYMEEEAERLMLDGMKKNYIDLDQYPQSADIHDKCIKIISNLFNAPRDTNPKGVGTGCIGSSEAIMLSGLAMKWKWKNRRMKLGLPYDKPNIVFGSNVQVCWHKMCRYFDIESREADVSPDQLVLTAERAKPLIDENTIGVCPILGSTFNGEFEDVKAIHDMVCELNEKNNWEIPIHVDAASGGFIAPFIHPNIEWDFRLPNVKSINVSGHKFGLVYAGIGWAVWREPQDLPDDLVFHVNYLGGDQAAFTLNFSKGAGNIIGQYYNFIRFGFEGYKMVLESGMQNAEYLREKLVATRKFEIVDKGHMPLVAFKLKEDYTKRYSVFDIQDKLRSRGWIVPAYTCSKGAEELAIMRVVVKQNFSRAMADMLVQDIERATEFLDAHFLKLALTQSGHNGKKKMTFYDVAHAIGHSIKHRKSGQRTHGVC